LQSLSHDGGSVVNLPILARQTLKNIAGLIYAPRGPHDITDFADGGLGLEGTLDERKQIAFSSDCFRKF